MLSQGLIEYLPLHGEILADTVHLLNGIVDRIERDGSDLRCFTTARTCICLYAAGVPETEGYQPGTAPPRSSEPSPREKPAR
jgi:hypothetical protein